VRALSRALARESSSDQVPFAEPDLDSRRRLRLGCAIIES
jgi:hypothetical protein